MANVPLQTLRWPAASIPASISPPVSASVFRFSPAGLFLIPPAQITKRNKRRGLVERTPLIVIKIETHPPSGRTSFAAKAAEHCAGGQGKQGQGGRFRNRRKIADLQQVYLSAIVTRPRNQ